MPDLKQANITIIGAGHMGGSLIGGLIADGYDPQMICAAAPHGDHLSMLAKRFGIRTASDNQEAIQGADIVLFAVTPAMMKTVAEECNDAINQAQPLLMSVVAGVTTTQFKGWLNGYDKLVRTMPNMPALVGSGATALFGTTEVDQAERDSAESIMRAVGLTVWVTDETMLDTVTAHSGSGPAYFFEFMAAMSGAAVELGLSKEDARLLAIQTALGAARLALETEREFDDLIQSVRVPGGTTEAALNVFDDAQLRTIVKKAMTVARDRAIELSKEG